MLKKSFISINNSLDISEETTFEVFQESNLYTGQTDNRFFGQTIFVGQMICWKSLKQDFVSEIIELFEWNCSAQMNKLEMKMRGIKNIE